ncbi:MAG TPA: DsrE family protein [Candidatus Obscuribacterales bacterium]
MNKWTLFLALSIMLTLGTGTTYGATVETHAPDPAAHPRAEAGSSGQRIVVPLSVFSDAKTGTYWTLKIATLLLKKGATVTLVLFADGARLADNRSVEEFQESGESVPFWKFFTTFVEGGGAVLVEEQSAGLIGLTATSLRAGSKFASAEEIADLMMKADKILTFPSSGQN